MKYMGSKRRIAKFILPIMLKELEKNNITTWIEPFVGGGNMIDKVPAHLKRIGADANPHVIIALTAIRDFPDQLPESVSEEYYRTLKGTPPSPVTSWIRFVCGFGGQFEGTYARQSGSDESTFPLCGKRNAFKQSPKLKNVELICSDYSKIHYSDRCLIYCDPPYQNTTGYKTGKFDHDKFFEWCREMAKENIVFVSEYSAPDDFVCVWEGDIKTNLDSCRVSGKVTKEKLFLVKPK